MGCTRQNRNTETQKNQMSYDCWKDGLWRNPSLSPYTHSRQSVNWASHCNFLPYDITLLLIVGQKARSLRTKENGTISWVYYFAPCFAFETDSCHSMLAGLVLTVCSRQLGGLRITDRWWVLPRLKTCRGYAIVDTGESVYSDINFWN